MTGLVTSGSSPRTRGTPEPLDLGGAAAQFIPADAGNATCSTESTCLFPVHPRGRGERSPCSSISFATGGSSPRARGTQLRVTVETLNLRFIPADAGNAAANSSASSAATVHPRGRGERLAAIAKIRRDNGSSPRTRGTRGRTIPSMIHLTVHPRGRGERESWSRKRASCGGSSPRTRGTQIIEPAGRSLMRFIPADAGNAMKS